MNPIILIPARMDASRLPGKPLMEIDGVQMIIRVLRQALEADIGPVAVAAGDRSIAEVVRDAGGTAVLTDPALPSGSDRILSALHDLDLDHRHDVIVNLQGDMPFVDPGHLAASLAPLAQVRSCDIATLVAREASPADRTNPDVVKAVFSPTDGSTMCRCLYFTRSTLFGDGPIWRHIGIYAYRRNALETFNAAPPSRLKRRERLEQLRALELGLAIWASPVSFTPISVDTAADLEAARTFASQS